MIDVLRKVRDRYREGLDIECQLRGYTDAQKDWLANVFQVELLYVELAIKEAIENGES